MKRATELCSQPSESHLGLELREGRTEAAAQPYSALSPCLPQHLSAQPPPAPCRGAQRKLHSMLGRLGGRPASCAHVRAAPPALSWGFLLGRAGQPPAPSSPEDCDQTPEAHAAPPASRLTSQRAEEVEEGVAGDLLGDGSHGASAPMLLLFLDGFDGHVLPFLPVDGTPTGIRP